jgi:hypothetical protein
VTKPQIALEIAWEDPADHMIAASVIASNGRFSGASQFYCYPNTLISWARDLDGFPRSARDSRELKVGGPDAYTDIAFDFRCFDEAGHTSVRAAIRESTQTAKHSPKDRVVLELRFEAAALDRFVEQLHSLGTEKAGVAVLDGIA